MDVEDPATECSASGEFTGSDNVECVPIEGKIVFNYNLIMVYY